MNDLFARPLFSIALLTLFAAALPALSAPPEPMFPLLPEVLGPEEELLPSMPVELDLRDSLRQPPSFQSSLGRLRSSDPQVQKDAVRELSRTRNLRAVPYLGALFLRSDADREARKAAAMALGRTGDWAALVYLKKGLDDPDAGIRFAVALALGRLRNDEAVSQLESKCLSDSNWWTRYAAAVALGQSRNPAAVPALRKALLDARWQVRQQAARSLGEFRSKPARDLLAWALKDPDPSVRYAAALSLAEVGDSESVELLRAARDSETEETARAGMNSALKRRTNGAGG